MRTYPKLSSSFYDRTDVVQISKDLIGKVLCSKTDGILTAGKIVETEAYDGRKDKACHAYRNTRTKRTEVMYGPPGRAYIYLCYGIHHLFNVVTNQEGLADAVLIRALEPLDGKEWMVERRGREHLKPVITNGPGKMSQAMGITTDQNEIDLLGDRIWIEDREIPVTPEDIVASKRIGVDYAGEDAELPWRFTLSESRWVSQKPEA